MGNPFGNLKTEGLEESTDRLGGYAAKESDIYTGKVKAFYAGQSAKGAHNVTVILAGGDFGQSEYRETVYITNRAGENFYLNPQDRSKKVPLPGFTTIDEMCLATVGKPLSEVEFEEKVMNIYDPEQKKELPKSVQMAVEMLGQEVSVAVLKTTENQTEKVGDDYVPKADGTTRDVNNIDKVFNTATKMTVPEARGRATEGAFWNSWLDRNKGKTRDKTEKAGGQGGQSGKPGGGAPAGGASAGGGGAPRSSLFGGNKA